MIDLTDIQTSIYTMLSSAPATYPVYDAVPQLSAKPYIVIGDMTEMPDEDLAVITTDATINLHTWSAKSSKAESHAMLDFIRRRLDGATLPGAWLCVEEFIVLMEDPSSTAASRLYHGVARYQVRAEYGMMTYPALGQFDLTQFDPFQFA